MEQVVWVYFGVITIVLAFGIVGNLIVKHKGAAKVELFDAALEKLDGQCDFVCDSGLNTRQSVDTELPSGIILYTRDERICGDYSGNRRCVNCNCPLQGYTLDLNTTVALETFETHIYRCYFTRGKDDISMECQG